MNTATQDGVIGVFDSGIGGLTVLAEIQRLLPDEPTVYLGDALRCPYGPRPRDQVRAFALQITHYLISAHRLKLLIVACNTASAAALPDVQAAASHIPVLGVIGPGAQAAVDVSATGRIGVIATAGTVASHAYQRAVEAVAPQAVTIEQACPALVPLVEAGQTDTPETEKRVREYLAPLLDAGIDTLILGCTHYPLLRPVLERVTAGRVQIVDSAATTAVQARAILQARHQLTHSRQEQRERQVYTTGPVDSFRQLAGVLFGPTGLTGYVRELQLPDVEEWLPGNRGREENTAGHRTGEPWAGGESHPGSGAYHGWPGLVGQHGAEQSGIARRS